MGKTTFLFPGQGAQYVGMGRSVYESLPSARALYEKADEILGYSLSKLCFEGPFEELGTTVVSQPAIFVTSMAALEQLKATHPEAVDACEITAGLSLGEYTALTFAGAVSFEDALLLVQRRGAAMQAAADATPSGMVSVLGCSYEEVVALCNAVRGDDLLEIANILCPGNTVVSGSNAACERLLEAAEGVAKVVPLAVAGAFHTEIMRPAVKPLQEALSRVIWSSPGIPVISNVDAAAHTDPSEISEILGRQILSPVLWEQTMRNMLSDGVDTFYEVGPGRVLRSLIKRIDRKVHCVGTDA